MSFRLTHTTAVAAAKAGFSTATGYRIESDPRLPSQKKTPRGRRRPDPLDGIWDTEIVPMLQSTPDLRVVAIFEEIVRRHPEIAPGVRRTMERRLVWPRSERRLLVAISKHRFKHRGAPPTMRKRQSGSHRAAASPCAACSTRCRRA